MNKHSLFFALLLPTAVYAAPSAQFSISPDRTLPALPVSFHITVVNPDNGSQPLPGGAVLLATPAAGEAFIALADNLTLVKNVRTWLEGVDRVNPHGRYAFDIPIDATLGNPSWFADPRLNRPGTYRLQIILTDASDATLRGATPATIWSRLSASALTSNEVVLSVDAPTGDDAVVWRLAAAEARGVLGSNLWLGAGSLMKKIWLEHPKSTYAQYIAIRVPLPTIEDRMKAVQQVLTANPNGPLADWQQLQIALLEEHLYGSAQSRQADKATLTDHAGRAVGLYRSVIRNAHSTRAKAVAQKKLDDLLDELADDGLQVP